MRFFVSLSCCSAFFADFIGILLQSNRPSFSNLKMSGHDTNSTEQTNRSTMSSAGSPSGSDGSGGASIPRSEESRAPAPSLAAAVTVPTMAGSNASQAMAVSAVHPAPSLAAVVAAHDAVVRSDLSAALPDDVWRQVLLFSGDHGDVCRRIQLVSRRLQALATDDYTLQLFLRHGAAHPLPLNADEGTFGRWFKKALGLRRAFSVSLLVFTEEQEQFLVEHIRSPHCNVKEITSPSNLLIDALAVNTSVQTVRFKHPRYVEQCHLRLAEALERNTTVHTIDLTGFNIGDEGARRIAEALERNTTVHTIYLYGNSIGDEGAHRIAEALERNTTVHTIDLNDNNIGAEGARCIAKALKRNTTVHTIYLGRNRIGAEGARRIAEALERNTTVHTINLSGNYIGAEGARRIADALKRNNPIGDISVNDRIQLHVQQGDWWD
jgi:hypothetical protein